MNEGSGSRIADISGYGNHGTLKNVSPNAQFSGWGGTRLGGGVELDGSDDYISCGGGSCLAPAKFTVSVDIFPRAWDSYNKIFCRYYNGDGYYVEQQYTAIVFYMYSAWSGVSTQFIAPDYGVDTNTWSNIIASTDGATMELYVNGQPASSDPSSPVGIPDTDFIIGASSSGSSSFNGIIDNCSVYNRSLSPSEKKQLYEDPFCNILSPSVARYYISPAGPRTTRNTRQTMNVHPGVMFQTY